MEDSSNVMKRIGEIVIKSGKELIGVNALFQALTEERSKRFINYLNSACEEECVEAVDKIRQLATSPNGEKILMHIARECFFGSESISLAAMAVLVSKHNIFDSVFIEIAPRSIEGLLDIDTLVFLVLMSRPSSCKKISSSWRPAFKIDAKVVSEPDWKFIFENTNFTEESIFMAVTECIRRRILLPDSVSGRQGYDKDLAVRYFSISENTIEFYRVFKQALEIVNPDIMRVLQLFSPEIVKNFWWLDKTET